MYPKKTATYKACEQASMLGLPISRTSQHQAKYTRRWKAARAWWNPPVKARKEARKNNIQDSQ